MMRLGLLQLNPTVGDLEGNARADCRRGASAPADVDLFVTSEMALTGYPARDLLLQRGFIARAGEVLAGLAARLAGVPPVLVGRARAERRAPAGRPLFNAAALLHGGRVERQFVKSLLPDLRRLRRGSLFRAGGWRRDAARSPAAAPRSASARTSGTIATSGSARATTTIRPTRRARSAPTSCSTCRRRRSRWASSAVREAMLGQIARDQRLFVVYVNQVGGNDDLVFDGRSVVIDRDGAGAGARRGVRAGGAGRRPRAGSAGELAPQPDDRRGRDVPGARPRHRRLRRASAASATCCSGCPAASTRR